MGEGRRDHVMHLVPTALVQSAGHVIRIMAANMLFMGVL